ncbi:MAG: universal stress protein [Paenisporosarcina sp.]
MYEKILLAVDGSLHSIRASEEAIKVSSMSSRCQVTVIMVADYTKSKNDVLHSGSSVELDMKRRKKIMPVEELLRKHNINYRVEILHGVPGPTIVEYANKHNVELLIMGSRGLNSLQEMVLGSVSHKVVKRANCPVLIVK